MRHIKTYACVEVTFRELGKWKTVGKEVFNFGGQILLCWDGRKQEPKTFIELVV